MSARVSASAPGFEEWLSKADPDGQGDAYAMGEAFKAGRASLEPLAQQLVDALASGLSDYDKRKALEAAKALGIEPTRD